MYHGGFPEYDQYDSEFAFPAGLCPCQTCLCTLHALGASVACSLTGSWACPPASVSSLFMPEVSVPLMGTLEFRPSRQRSSSAPADASQHVLLRQCCRSLPGYDAIRAHLSLPSLPSSLPCSSWTLSLIALFSDTPDSCAVFCSSGQWFAMDFLQNVPCDKLPVLRLEVPAAGPLRSLSPPRLAPCRTHTKKEKRFLSLLSLFHAAEIGTADSHMFAQRPASPPLLLMLWAFANEIVPDIDPETVPVAHN